VACLDLILWTERLYNAFIIIFFNSFNSGKNMGNFYVNYTVRTTNAKKVAGCLKGRSAFVTPVDNGFVVVFDEESDTQDGNVFTELGMRLSKELQTTVFGVLNHDDDILWYLLFVNGSKVDEYNSSPNFFTEDDDSTPPSGGNAELLCNIFEKDCSQKIDDLLREKSDDKHFVHAVERHAALVEALDLPLFAIGMGFNYISRGELPEGLSEGDLLRV
jgi:hypothetical protein